MISQSYSHLVKNKNSRFYGSLCILNFMSKYTASSQQVSIILCSKLTDTDTGIKSSADSIFEFTNPKNPIVHAEMSPFISCTELKYVQF